MTETGVNYFALYATDLFRVISIGELHGKYDTLKPNALHKWLDKNKLISDNVNIIVEDTHDFDYRCTRSVIFRFFKNGNVFDANYIRRKAMPMLGIYIDDLRAHNESEYYINMEKLLCNYPQEVKNDNYNLDNFSNTFNLKIWKYFPQDNDGFIQALSFADKIRKIDNDNFRYKGILTGLNDNEFDKLKDYLKYRVKDTDFPVDNNKINQMLFCSLYIYDYIYLNFMVRTAKFMSHTNNKDYATNYDELEKFLIKDTKKKQHENICLLANLYDYIAILKLIDLYYEAEESKTPKLVWLASGMGHNKNIDDIILGLNLFNFDKSNCLITRKDNEILKTLERLANGEDIIPGVSSKGVDFCITKPKGLIKYEFKNLSPESTRDDYIKTIHEFINALRTYGIDENQINSVKTLLIDSTIDYMNSFIENVNDYKEKTGEEKEDDDKYFPYYASFNEIEHYNLIFDILRNTLKEEYSSNLMDIPKQLTPSIDKNVGVFRLLFKPTYSYNNTDMVIIYNPILHFYIPVEGSRNEYTLDKFMNHKNSIKLENITKNITNDSYEKNIVNTKGGGLSLNTKLSTIHVLYIVCILIILYLLHEIYVNINKKLYNNNLMIREYDYDYEYEQPNNMVIY